MMNHLIANDFERFVVELPWENGRCLNEQGIGHRIIRSIISMQIPVIEKFDQSSNIVMFISTAERI
jgi:hypothetical protein